MQLQSKWLLLLVFFSITNFSASFAAIALVAGKLPKREKERFLLENCSAENLVSKECDLLHARAAMQVHMYVCAMWMLATSICAFVFAVAVF